MTLRDEPRGCLVCDAPCVRSVMHTVPDGWLRLRNPRDGKVVILCPKHRYWPGPFAAARALYPHQSVR